MSFVLSPLLDIVLFDLLWKGPNWFLTNGVEDGLAKMEALNAL